MPNKITYVDVDDTLIRTAGTKRIPIPNVVQYVREQVEAGVSLYCWSSGGAEYAKEVAEELGIAQLFVTFLPKPSVMIDDQRPDEWRYLRVVHPNEVG
ncbi:MAG: hydrolase [Pseudomonadota bacterium]